MSGLIYIVAAKGTPDTILTRGYRRLSHGQDRGFCHHTFDRDMYASRIADQVKTSLIRNNNTEVLFDNIGFYNIDMVRLIAMLRARNVGESLINSRIHPLYTD